jgi:hypothetical protein
LTDSFAVAYYTNADALSFHEPPGFEGPVDATCEYTNRSDLGTVLPIDAMDSIISGLHSGKELAVTECYPFAPDVLGKTNSWWLWNGGYNSTN